MKKRFAMATEKDSQQRVAWTCAPMPDAIDDFSVPQQFAEVLIKN
jgi:hypothetical protein